MFRRLLRQWESPPTWLLLFVGLAGAQAWLLPLIDAGRFGDMAGAAVVMAAAAMLIAASLQFRRHRTTIMPREVPQAMITDGLYAYSRNPIYVADALILTGVALIWDAAALILVPVFVAVITARFIRGEEAGMKAQFGAAFDHYAARVRRWI